MNEEMFNFEELCNAILSSDATININKKIAIFLGIETSIYLSTLIWKRKWFINHDKINHNESFFNTQDDMQEATLLPPHKQTQAINILKQYNLIDVEKKGCPARNYFTLKYDLIHLILSIPSQYLNDQSISVFFTSEKASYSLVKKRLNDYINNLKETSLKETSLKESSSKEEDYETDVSSTASLKKPIRLHKRKSKLLRQTKPNIPIKEKRTKPFIPNERALRLLTIWEKKGLKVISHKPETKAYKNSLIAIDRLLSGKAFNGSEYEAYQNYKFTTKEIMQAIDRFAMMALNPDYEPRNIEYKKTLAKTYFSDFIFNSFKSENGYGRSMFLYCLNNEAKIIKEKDIVIEDKYPKLTKAIMNLYKDKILGIDNFQFTNSDMNDFRKASILAWELFEKNKNRLMGSYRNMDAFQIAKTIFEALEQSGANPTKVKPYWLCNAVMKKQLPAYLYQSAILQGSSNESLSKPQAYYDFGKPFSE